MFTSEKLMKKMKDMDLGSLSQINKSLKDSFETILELLDLREI